LISSLRFPLAEKYIFLCSLSSSCKWDVCILGVFLKKGF
jgi:hypothetical protein